jgi:hypothetical protein
MLSFPVGGDGVEILEGGLKVISMFDDANV